MALPVSSPIESESRDMFSEDVEHVKHVKKSQKLFTCNLCLVNFSSRSGYDKHMATHLSKQTGQYPFTCQQCGFGTLYASQLSKHQQKAHNPFKTYTCDVCGRNFSLSKTLKVHKASQHNEKEHQDKEVSNQTIIPLHAHKLSSDYPVIIQENSSIPSIQSSSKAAVGITNTSLEALESLKREHASKIVCDVCGQTFRKDWLNRHKQTVHKIGEKKTRIEIYSKLNCPQCGKLISAKGIASHLRTVHQVKIAVQIYCHQCGDKMLSTSIENHVKVCLIKKYQKSTLFQRDIPGLKMLFEDQVRESLDIVNSEDVNIEEYINANLSCEA